VSGNFGANDWLVEEMYEKYMADPNSVEATWRDFFNSSEFKAANFSPSAATTITSNGNSNATSNGGVSSSGNAVAGAPRGGTPPLPKAQTKQAATPTPAPAVTPAPQTFTPQPTVSQPRVTTTPTPADPIAQPVKAVATPAAASIEPIRGVGARVVQSMEASLSVPTATSVRAIPAKLLIDNRTVINNHLKRARGGKVSFTHLIGFAMIKALRAMPEMNAFYTEVDSKPALGHPEHINLGIAIDLAKADGSRQLLVPSIKGCESLDFAQFHAQYEALVKKARDGALAVEDFAGTTVSLTNPGTIGTVHSVPRLVQGQGLILGVGSMDYPAEFQGASATIASSKAHNLVISYVESTKSSWERRTSSMRSSQRFESLTSPFDGSRTSNSPKTMRSTRHLESNN